VKDDIGKTFNPLVGEAYVEEFLKLYGSGDSAAMAFGIFLAFLGLFAPKKFFGIEFDWTSATSATALIVGAVFFAFSYPQLRFWQSDTVNVPRSVLIKLASNSKSAKDALDAARRGPDYPNCNDKAGVGLAPMSDSMAILKTLGAVPAK